MVMAVIVAVFINHERTQELTRINADALLLTGKPIAAALAEGLREREREAMLLSHHPLLTQGALDSVIVHAHFDEIKQSFPFYSWIGVADTDGLVQVSTGGLLKHQHVTQRPWFVEGLKGPYTGDAHEALLLASICGQTPMMSRCGSWISHLRCVGGMVKFVAFWPFTLTGHGRPK